MFASHHALCAKRILELMGGVVVCGMRFVGAAIWIRRLAMSGHSVSGFHSYHLISFTITFIPHHPHKFCYKLYSYCNTASNHGI